MNKQAPEEMKRQKEMEYYDALPTQAKTIFGGIILQDGEDLDRVGLVMRVPRFKVESDTTYRTRLFIEFYKEYPRQDDERKAPAEDRLNEINNIICAKGAPLGSDEYFKIRELCTK